MTTSVLSPFSSGRICKEENVEAEWKRIWEIQPVLFDPKLIQLREATVHETCGTVHRMPSGALHDACEVARAGIPTAMLFVQSLRGLSHTKEEDTTEAHLLQSVEALQRVAITAMQWVATQS